MGDFSKDFNKDFANQNLQIQPQIIWLDASVDVISNVDWSIS